MEGSKYCQTKFLRKLNLVDGFPQDKNASEQRWEKA